MENLSALRAQGKPCQYQLFPELSHNTAFAKSGEPMEAAIAWMKAFQTKVTR
jgi:hypothetical protein